MGSELARMIVCDRSGYWAALLRHHLTGTGLRVWETRTLLTCWEQLEEFPASFVVVQLMPYSMDDLFDRLGLLSREFPESRLTIVASRSMAHYQWLVRELGAVHFTCSPRQIAAVAELACRHLAQVPEPTKSLTERIWSTLPWDEVAQES